MKDKPTKGIAIDGSCLNNPGFGEYRGVDIATGKELFRHKFSKTTNNLMEFFGVVHALRYNKENGKEYSHIYTDSVTALAWTKNWEVKSNLVKDESTKLVWVHVDNCLRWLSNNTKKDRIDVYKWETEKWGEIPADFGRKNGSANSKVVTTDATLEKLKAWVLLQEKDEFADITTLARLKRDFNL